MATRTKDAPEMRERDHLEGCPAERVESFPNRKPPMGGMPARDVIVTRCMDCGEQRVKEA